MAIAVVLCRSRKVIRPVNVFPVVRIDASVETGICQDDDLALEQADEKQNADPVARTIESTPKEKRLSKLRRFDVAPDAVYEQARERRMQDGEQCKKRAAAEYDQDMPCFRDRVGPAAGGNLPDDARQRRDGGTEGECFPRCFRVGIGFADDGGNDLRPGPGLEIADAGCNACLVLLGHWHVRLCARNGACKRIVNALVPVQEAILTRKIPGPMVDRSRRTETRASHLRAASL